MPQAIQITEYGAPGVLKSVEVPMPKPGRGEVVVRTIAAAVNRADCEIRSGKWTIQSATPFPYTPGIEVVGVIESVGKSSCRNKHTFDFLRHHALTN